MKMRINFLCFFLLVLLSTPTFSQGPGEPYHPMTAPGANGITIVVHSLIWQNPPSTVYNKIYFSANSSLVNSLDSSVIIYNGFPSTVYSNVPLSIVGPLEYFKKYYWKVVEYNSAGYTIGNTWNFTTTYSGSQPLNETFSNGLQNWQRVGPNGIQNWSISYTSYAGGNDPELEFNYSPPFTGMSAIMLDMELIGQFGLSFKHRLFWYGNPFTIGCGYTTDSGNSWIPIWETTANGNIGPETKYGVTPSNYEGYKIGFYYAGNSTYYGIWYIDNLILDGPLTPCLPPFFLTALSDTSQLKIYLNWQSTYCPVSIIGYEIRRKEGLPLDLGDYVQLTITDENTFSFIDENILPNKIYTYKIRTLWSLLPRGSHWGNEATAYVPDIITSVAFNNEIPTEFSLEQNYPNPFNPTTIIKYRMPSVETHCDASLQVKLTVFDILGNEVATLVNEQKPAGRYEVEFNDSALPSGVYFYQLKAGEYVNTKKMILLR
jgi:hypothetical protein